jgi:ThiF family protein
MNEAEFRIRLEEATLAYQPTFRADDRPVVVSLAAGVESPAGDALLCGLVNQLARTHRHLVLVGNLDRPLLCRDPFGKASLLGATAGNASAINPLLAVDVVQRMPSVDAIARLSIGDDKSDCLLGCEGWDALAGQGVQVGAKGSDIYGALLASIMGAWFAFMRLLGRNPRLHGRYGLWNYAKPEAGGGPALDTVPNLGRVLQVGAGGVGAGLNFWLAMLGGEYEWTIVDGDLVEVGNLNRQLIFKASDAGFPEGPMRKKARLAAERLGGGATASTCWYGEDPDVVAAEYDVVLALANERGAREALQDRRPNVLLHATTSPNHQAQLHRHLSEVDDCIRCRLPGPPAQTACATAPVAEVASDAALPYLSGLAGLLLIPILVRQSLEQLTKDQTNLFVVDLGGDQIAQQSLRMKCRETCAQHRVAA